MREYRTNHPARRLLAAAKCRAKKFGLRFDITETDIIVGEICPVLGIRFKRGVGGKPCETSPTLDRIDNKKGYVSGNVVVISYLANRIKSSADATQIGRVATWLKKKLAARGRTIRATSRNRHRGG